MPLPHFNARLRKDRFRRHFLRPGALRYHGHRFRETAAQARRDWLVAHWAKAPLEQRLTVSQLRWGDLEPGPVRQLHSEHYCECIFYLTINMALFSRVACCLVTNELLLIFYYRTMAAKAIVISVAWWTNASVSLALTIWTCLNAWSPQTSRMPWWSTVYQSYSSTNWESQANWIKFSRTQSAPTLTCLPIRPVNIRT